MPQVGAALIAVGNAFAASSVGTFLTTTAVGKFLASTAISMAMSALSVALSPKPKNTAGGIQTEVTTSGSKYARSFILGHYATAAHGVMPPLVFDTDKDDNRYLTYVLDVADTRIDGIQSMIIDGQPQTLVAQRLPGHPGYRTDDEFGQRVSGELEDRAWLRWHDGSQTEADSMLLSKFEQYPERPITSDFVFKGVAYAITTFKYYNDDPKFSGLPDVRFVVRGKPLYDPRKDSSVGGSGSHRWANENTYEFTSNPVVMIYNVMRGITLAPGHVWGVGVPAYQLPLDRWFAAMNVCEEAGTQAGSSNWADDQKRYRAGIEVSVDQEPLDIVEELLKSCGGVMAPVGDGYLITVGAPSIPVAHFTDDDLELASPASFTMSSGLAGTYNGVIAGYPSPQHLWEEKDAVPYFNPVWEAHDDGRRLTANVKFGAVPYGRQVRRLMREMAADNRRKRQHMITLMPQYLGINPTDTISWTSATNGYNAKLFEVISKTIDAETLTVGLVLRERDPSDYDFDAVSDSNIPYAPPTTNVIPIIEGVRGFSAIAVIAKDANGRDRRAGIKLMWAEGVSYQAISYEVRLAGSTDVAIDGTINDVPRGFKNIFAGVLPNTAYQIRARAIRSSGRAGAWSGWINVTTANVAELAPDVVEVLEELEDWIRDLDSAFIEDLDALRNAINTDLEAVQGDITTVRTDLGADVADARQTALDSLDFAKAYTDTAIITEQNVRQSQNDAMATRIDILSAALVSDPLLLNGNFNTGATGFDFWTRTGTTARVAANPSSTDALIASQPSPYSVQINAGGTGAISQQVANLEIGPSDEFQFKFKAGGLGAVARTFTVQVRWFNAASAEITPASSVNLSVPGGGVWRTLSGKFTPPEGAASAEFKITHTSASGQRILMTAVEATLVNIGVEAQIAELEVAQANTSAALATLSSSIDSRFNDADAAITLEASTRATAIGAVSDRVSVVEASYANSAAKIVSVETAIANANTTIANLTTTVGANYNDLNGKIANSAAKIVTVETAVANANNAISSLTTTVNSNFTSLDGRITTNATAINNRFTKTETNSAISAALDTYNASINTRFGQKADSTVVAGLISRVETAEGNITSQSNDVTTLSNSLEVVTTTANGKGKVIYANTAPTALVDRQSQNLWINTTGNNNIPNRWNGSAWVTVRDKAATDALAGLAIKADTTALNALTSRVATNEGDISAHATSLTNLTASVGRVNAGGRFRLSTVATPTGALARAGIHLEASNGQTTSTAGFFMVARSNGTSDVIFNSARFSVTTGDGANDARVAPFRVKGGTVYITQGVIEDLTITRGKIGDGQISGWAKAKAAGAIKSSKTANTVLAQVTLTKGRKEPMPLWFKASYPQGADLILQRRVGAGAWVNVMTVADKAIRTMDHNGRVSTIGTRSGDAHTYIDDETTTGSISYRLIGRSYTTSSVNYGGGGSEASWVTSTVRADHNFTNRLIGIFNIHK